MALIILIWWSMRITLWWWWHTPTHLYSWWKEKQTLIFTFNPSLVLYWQGRLSPRNWKDQKNIFLHCLMVCVVLSFPMTFGCPIRRRRFFNDGTLDVVQPNTSRFSTRHLIWVNYKILSQLFQPIYLEFSYLNSVQHFSGIELCREQNKNLRLQRKSTYNFLLWIFLLFSIMHISTFISPESSQFCG